MKTNSETHILGLGNPIRGDDGVGPHVINLIRDLNLQDVSLHTLSGEASEIMDAWQGLKNVIVIDCVVSGSSHGTIHYWDARKKELPSHFTKPSTHAFGLAQAVALSRTLGGLPENLTVIGIEGTSFEYNQPLTDPVKKAAEKVVEWIVQHTQKYLTEK